MKNYKAKNVDAYIASMAVEARPKLKELREIIKSTIPKAEDYISSVIKKFIQENIVKDGSFFLIHFDSLSQEQSILMKQ